MATKLTKDIFIDRSISIHNNKYDYKLVDYVNINTKVKIICPTHGVFEQTPKKHLKGQGCGKCKGFKKSTYDIVKEFTNIHGDKYIYSKVYYKGAKSKVIVICKEHGEFKITPNDHLNGIGCKKCGIKIRNIKNTLTTQDFIEKANKIHKNKYDYSLVEYKNTHVKVKIICKIHGIFEQTPHSHLRGNGCQFCKESKSENIISDILKTKNINFIRQKSFDDCKGLKNKLLFDFYLPDYNICIEYDGIHHFKPIEYFGGVTTYLKTVECDKIKNEYCKNKGIRLIRIKYDQDILNILNENLFKILNIKNK